MHFRFQEILGLFDAQSFEGSLGQITKQTSIGRAELRKRLHVRLLIALAAAPGRIDHRADRCQANAEGTCRMLLVAVDDVPAP